MRCFTPGAFEKTAIPAAFLLQLAFVLAVASSTASGSADVPAAPGHAEEGDSSPTHKKQHKSTPRIQKNKDRGAPKSDRAKGKIIYGETVDSGAVIAGNKVLARPYQVGSRGNDIFVNKLRVAVLPGPRQKSGQPETVPKPSRAVTKLVATIERRLFNNEVLIVFDEETHGFLSEKDAAFFLQDLIQAKTLQERVRRALTAELRGTDAVTTAQWRDALADFKPSEDLNRFIEERLADREDSDTEVEDSPPAPAADTMSRRIYALNVVGMILAVVSAGILLSHRPESAGGWSTVADSQPRLKLIGQCLVLIVLLQAFDLLCTLMAGSAGDFEELNPLAGSLIAAPAALALFKLTMTAIAVGILWKLRRYAGAQLASWWLCLLLTILTARWVTVQSLFVT